MSIFVSYTRSLFPFLSSSFRYNILHLGFDAFQSLKDLKLESGSHVPHTGSAGLIYGPCPK